MGVTRQELLDAGVPEERCAARSPVTSVPAPAGTATGGAAAVDAATQEQEPEPEPAPAPPPATAAAGNDETTEQDDLVEHLMRLLLE